jgi:transcriptional regulator with XRE-family HTH domain
MQVKNIKKLRELLGYTQEQLAKLLKVSRSTVAMWETTEQEPSYEIVSNLSLLFNVSSDFLMGTGIFKKWNQIIEYYDDVAFALKEMIPPTLEMPSFSEDKNLNAWLDTRRYFDPDEIQLARWFAFSVKDIQITPTGIAPDGSKTAEVKIKFTPEFNAIIESEKRKKIIPIPANEDGLSDMEQQLMRYVRDLNPDQQQMLLAQMHVMKEAQKGAPPTFVQT